MTVAPKELTQELEALLAETYSLWDPGWVTFNWRGYTYDHVQRVRGLALTLCHREGGDCLVTELAALLHDITKPYDGEYITDSEGHRVTDERGYWQNEVRRPTRQNAVTALYDELGLDGRLHNESGAIIAERLLLGRGVKTSIAQDVAQTIVDHLVPHSDPPIPSRCLYDADTIDANIGLPAFVRNIYINLHFYDVRKRPDEPTFAEIMRDGPMAFVTPYVHEKLPTWAAGKRRDFVHRLLTASARELAIARLNRLDQTFVSLANDLARDSANGHRDRIAILLHYMRHQADPSIARETARMVNEWSPADTQADALDMLRAISMEISGAV